MNIVKANVSLVSPEFVLDDVYLMIERAARTCYQSGDRISEGSAEKMIKMLMEKNHGAMLEHADLSLCFLCDRGVSHEVVRHRLASYAQESTRYCNYSKDKFGNSVTYIDIRPGMEIENVVTDMVQFQAIFDEWERACADAEYHYFRMLELGATPQIARSVLNNSTKTQIVVKMNMREWRHFLSLRNAPAAHPQMREVAQQVMALFKEKLPLLVSDME